MIVVRCSKEWKATSSGQFCLTDIGSLTDNSDTTATTIFARDRNQFIAIRA